METKHTKGEWESKPTQTLNKNNRPLYYDIQIDGQSFISTHRNIYLDISDDEQEANAKLIAAAPEMLQMILLLVDRLEENDCGQLSAVKRAKELIKKATE